jgi:hypothetical protein
MQGLKRSFKRRLSSWGGSLKNLNASNQLSSISRSIKRRYSTADGITMKATPAARIITEVNIRLAVWLCMIRCRLRDLQEMTVSSVCVRTGYRIRSPPVIESVLSVWMQGVLFEAGSVKMDDPCDGESYPLLCVLISLMLQEARKVADYRELFVFLVQRINLYVEFLMRGVFPAADSAASAGSACLK